MSEAYEELGGGIRTTGETAARPRVGFIPGSECPLHRGYPLETSDGRCTRCRRDADEVASKGDSRW